MGEEFRHILSRDARGKAKLHRGVPEERMRASAIIAVADLQGVAMLG
jgi:hypothetical protein